MNSRIKRRNQNWIALDGDHAEFETAYYTTDIAKGAMTENKKTKGNFTKKVTKTRRSKLASLTKEEAKARRQNMKESKIDNLEKIRYLPHKTKPTTDKELNLYKKTLYGIKCLIQNYTTSQPKSDKDVRLNIFLNRKNRKADVIYNDETADIVRFVSEDAVHNVKLYKRTKKRDVVITFINHLISIMYPSTYAHLTLSVNNKPTCFNSGPCVKNPYWFDQETIDKYNAIQLFKEQMFK